MTDYTYKTFKSTKLNSSFGLRAYVFYPPEEIADGSHVVVLFHGGAWSSGTPVYYFPLARHLASQGITAIAFQYRTKDVFNSTPEESTADAVSAIRWLRKNESKLRLVAPKITAIGDSAGAHLALVLNLNVGNFDELGTPDQEIPYSTSDIVAFYPPVDLKNLVPLSYIDVGLEHPSISPDSLLEKSPTLPATLILHGTRDDIPWTQFSKTKAFCDKVNEIEGARTCKIKPYVGRKHAFLNVRADYDKAVADVDNFLFNRHVVSFSPKFRLDTERPECRLDMRNYDVEKAKWGYGSNTSSRWQ